MRGRSIEAVVVNRDPRRGQLHLHLADRVVVIRVGVARDPFVGEIVRVHQVVRETRRRGDETEGPMDVGNEGRGVIEIGGLRL